MATQFIGVTVLVTLKSPPGAQLQGLVEDVNAEELTLRNVYFPQNGYRMPEYRIAGAQIEDLEIAPTAGETPEPSIQQSVQPSRPNQTKQQFTDPAILSVGPKPAQRVDGVYRQPSGQESKAAAPQETLADTTQYTYSVPKQTRVSTRPAIAPAAQPNDPPAVSTAATLIAPFTDMSLNGHADGAGSRAPPPAGPVGVQASNDTQMGKRSRRGGRTKTRKDAAIQTPALANTPGDDLDTLQDSGKKREGSDMKGTAWRESALLEDRGDQFSGTMGRHVGPSRRKGRRQRPMTAEVYDGWATEEATDIQGMGEFDFAGNLSKFDKKSVFSQIRADDTTADESRLVSFNRSQQSKGNRGSGDGAGTRKIHHTENVLDPGDHMAKWNSEAGDSAEEEESETGFGSGKNSHPGLSRQSTHRQPSSRKDSAIFASNPNLASSAHLMSALNRGGGQRSSSIAESPKLSKYSPSGSPRPGVPPSTSTGKPALRLISSNRVCPVVSPLQMLDVERIAEVELGLTEDIMTENAARCIAEVALLALNPGGGRLDRENHNALPVVLVLAGNNKSGARAVAGGRHLRNHGVRVITCVLGLEREEEFLDGLRRQLNIFRSIGGRVVRWPELATTLKSFDAPAELVIDGLLGMHVAFEDLRNDDQLTAYELIAWANASKANVLAVDVPTGLDASTGEVSMLEEQPLQLRARFIVAMGAPKTGLLNALMSGQGHGWQLFVADIGISNTAWRKYGTRRRHGVEFASDWVVGLRYHGSVE